MGITRADLTDEHFSEKDRQEMAVAVSGYEANDAWGPRIKSDVGILLISHSAARCYLTGAIESYRKLGYWITVIFDSYIDPACETIDHNQFLPPVEVMKQIDTFVITHYQTWGGVSYPFMWSLKIGANLMNHFKYVFVANSDCIIEKPEGFSKLLEIMGDADIMSAGPVAEREIGTAGFLARGSALQAIGKHMLDHVVPLEEYEKSTQEFGNTEGRFAVAVRDLELKQKIVDPPLNEQLHIPGHGTWYDLIGFRHIHGEHNYAYRYKGIPPHYKYFDQRFMGDEYIRIKEYWETKDIKILENWWAKD